MLGIITGVRRKLVPFLIDVFTLAAFVSASVAITMYTIDSAACGLTSYTAQMDAATEVAVICSIVVFVLARCNEYRNNRIGNLESH